MQHIIGFGNDMLHTLTLVVAWCSSNIIGCINEVYVGPD